MGVGLGWIRKRERGLYSLHGLRSRLGMEEHWTALVPLSMVNEWGLILSILSEVEQMIHDRVTYSITLYYSTTQLIHLCECCSLLISEWSGTLPVVSVIQWKIKDHYTLLIYLSPSLSLTNCSEIMHAKVGPTSELSAGSSRIPPV